MEIYNKNNEFSKYINNYFNRNYYTNNTRNIDYFNNLIEKKRLYFYEIGSSTFLFEKKYNHFFMFFYMEKNSMFQNLKTDGTVVTEFVYRKEEDYNIIYKNLVELGFRKSTKRYAYRLKIENKYDIEQFQFTIGKEEDLEFIFYNLSNSFHPLAGCLLPKEKLREKINNSQVLLMIKEEHIYGIVEFTKVKNIGIIDHILVVEEFRNQGYSLDLIKGFINFMKENGIIFIDLWVNEENSPAIKMYEKAGFKFKGLNSQVMIKEV